MRGASDAEARAAIVDAAVVLLEDGGFDGVQQRKVAQLARVSLARVYRLTGTRDELVVAAVEQWMASNVYARLTAAPEHLAVRDRLMHVLRGVFEPWEREPRMLEAFHRARCGPAGERLIAQGADALGPMIRAALDGTPPDYVADVQLLLFNVLYAVFGRFADGEIEITDILPILDRATFRLTAADTVGRAPGQPRSRPPVRTATRR
jgi:AcrR family transcriptional regulator